ncbi:3-isopropylmalate/(R)-2-methylmalate dehydratase small subunit [Parasphingorhabdus marina DSM 22363]|uniref:3-isopropylmalate dehydratase small subunit n=1 Tax=Parasphingorhabdus marina DSM 22363 TaxID=1123272 RepID=A0A1N6CN33_9SPHN|nr:3-isopropylmalate dehydratase small subunit [Parasphingorhabdus marina]SIN59784.1 3-isopropylmalate/(R)-2-methylmalate dehydratase small subunit [Parasphingorhabdus marina DSM 22363]
MAEPFTTLTSLPMPLIRDNIDTDQIIPSREMKSTGKTGLADGLFAGWRYTAIGGRDPDESFVLNDPDFANSRIILGGENFGCGSSREHAVWALAEYGFRAVIAPSFAPIFAGNCVRNGILPAVLDAEHVAAIAESGKVATISLPDQTIAIDGANSWPFPLEAEAKAMLLEGLDAIDLSLKMANEISTWQEADRAARPWIYPGATA